jgi:hypothetical protein
MYPWLARIIRREIVTGSSTKPARGVLPRRDTPYNHTVEDDGNLKAEGMIHQLRHTSHANER